MKNFKASNALLPPKVSVIMPTYNGATFIRKSIDSVLNQSFKNFELIIINDGSTDNTGALIRKYRDERIVCLENKVNMGTSAARNKGIRHARGEYIAFCDHDDIFYTNHLKVLSEYLDSHLRIGLAYADSYALFRKRKNRKKLILHSVDFEKHLLEICNFINPSEVMCRAECFRKAGLFDNHPIIKKHSSEDWDMWLRISDLFQCVHIRKVLGEFHFHQANRTTQTNFSLSYQHTIAKRINRLNKKQKNKYIQNCSVSVIYNLSRIYPEHRNLAYKITQKFSRIKKTAPIHAGLGLCYLSQGKHKKAFKHFQQSLPKLENYARRHLWYAQNTLPLIYSSFATISSFLGHYREAELLLRKTLFLTTSKSHSTQQQSAIPKEEVLRQLAYLYLKMGQYGKALAISKQCDPIRRYSIQGWYYWSQKMYKKSISKFEKHIKLGEKSLTHAINLPAAEKVALPHSFIYSALGVAYFKTGNRTKALRAFKKALELNSTLLQARNAVNYISQ